MSTYQYKKISRWIFAANVQRSSKSKISFINVSDFTIADDELGVGRNKDEEAVYPDYYPGGKKKSRKAKKPKKVKKSKKNIK